MNKFFFSFFVAGIFFSFSYEASEAVEGNNNFSLSESKRKQNSNHKIPLISIKNVSDIESSIQHGDWVFIDIDDTLLRTGGDKQYGEESKVLNLDPKAPLMIKFLKEKSLHLQDSNRAIRVFALTSRSERSRENTLKQLKDLGYEFDDVIFAPYKEGERISEKGESILELLKKAQPHQSPKRILCIDDLSENLEKIYADLEKTKIPLKLYQKESNVKLYGAEDFPEEISKLALFDEDFSPKKEDSCLYKVKDENGRIYFLNTLSKPSEMKLQILLNALYQSLGFYVPKFAVYDHLPKKLKNTCHFPGPFKLTQFISSQDGQNPLAVEKEMQKSFVTDAFFNNLDFLNETSGNVILDQEGTLWRIPEDSLTQLIERDRPLELKIESLKNKHNFYKTISQEYILQQVYTLLQKAPLLWKTIDEVDESIHLEKAQSVKEILLSRLHSLVQKYGTPEKVGLEKILKDDLADPDLKPSKNSGAGILVYSQDPQTKEPVVFLAKRGFEKSWGTLGGKSDASDVSFSQTASREVLEESIELFKFSSSKVRDFSSHDLVSKNGVFRLYAGYHEYVPLDDFQSALKGADDRHQKEHTDFMWIPVKQLLELLKKDPSIQANENVKLGKLVLFGPLYQMLMEPAVQDTLKKISLKIKPKLLHTKTGFNPEISTKYNFPADTQEKIVPLGRTATGEIISERSYGNGQDYIYHDPAKEKQSLVDAIASHGSVIAELKQKKPLKQSKTPSSENFNYSQTEAYLQLALGVDKDFRGIDSKELVKLFLKKRSKFRNEEVFDDQAYENILTEVLDAERKKSSEYVFYHYTDSEKAFYIDIVSAFRTFLQLEAPGKLTLLRGLDHYFSSFQNVEDFIQKFKDASGDVYNYRGNYQQMGLSVNPFLFGSDGQKGESSYYLFYKKRSAAESVDADPAKDVPTFDLLLSKFLSSVGSNKSLDRYHDLYRRYFQDGKNTRLFQIFISPKILNEVAYISTAGGNLWHFYLNANEKELQTEMILKSIRQSPKIFKILSSKSQNRRNVKDIDFFQARLFMKPEIFHNPKLVQIKSYWRFPLSTENQKRYEQELQSLVAEDVREFLKNQNAIDPKIFSEGKTKLQKVHDHIFEGITGGKKTLNEQEINEATFPLSVDKNEKMLIEKLINEHPEILLKKEKKPVHFSRHETENMNFDFESFYFLKKNNWETIKKFSHFTEIPSLFLFALDQQDEEVIQEFVLKNQPLLNKIYFLQNENKGLETYYPLSYVANKFRWPEAKKLILLLLQLGADPNLGDVDLLRFVLQNLENVNYLEETDRLLITLLLKKQTERDKEKYSVQKGKNKNSPKKLFSGQNLLSYAMKMPNIKVGIEVGTLLLKNGVDPDKKEDKQTLLHIAQDLNIKFVELLIAFGANVNARGVGGQTPLFSAAFNGHKKIFDVLLKNKANINAKDNNRKTMLLYVLERIANAPKPNTRITKIAAFLIQRGADTEDNKIQELFHKIRKDPKKNKLMTGTLKSHAIHFSLNENEKILFQISSAVNNQENKSLPLEEEKAGEKK